MTPYEIKVLLHYYYSPEDYPDMESELFGPTSLEFMDLGLFAPGLSTAWKLTEKGQFYVKEGLCKVPLPVSDFRIPYDQA